MFPENITGAVKKKACFIKLEIKSYYLEARKKNRDFVNNLIT